MLGDFALSLAGHDKGEVYVVIGREGDRLLLSDGRHHGLDNPKKKNPRHVQAMANTLEDNPLSDGQGGLREGWKRDCHVWMALKRRSKSGNKL